MTYIDPMVPNRNDRQHIPAGSHTEITDEQKKVSIVLSTQAIVNPRAMVIHLKDTLIAHLTVGGPRWLDLITGAAFFSPHLGKVVHGLVPVLHHTFNLT